MRFSFLPFPSLSSPTAMPAVSVTYFIHDCCLPRSDVMLFSKQLLTFSRNCGSRRHGIVVCIYCYTYVKLLCICTLTFCIYCYTYVKLLCICTLTFCIYCYTYVKLLCICTLTFCIFFFFCIRFMLYYYSVLLFQFLHFSRPFSPLFLSLFSSYLIYSALFIFQSPSSFILCIFPPVGPYFIFSCFSSYYLACI
jgi:hypothetical protein